MQGDLIHGEVHSTDASAGVEILIYNAGSLVARTLAANEYIEVHSFEAIAAAAGNLEFFLGASSTPQVGEHVIQATVAVNSGVVMSKMAFVGANGSKPYIKAAAGVVDVNFTGVIRIGKSVGQHPAWKAALKTAGA